MNNTLHIAFLTSEYPHTNLSKSGGIGTSIKNLAIGLVKSGARVSIFVVGQINDLKIRDHNVEVIAIGKQKHIAFNWYFERKRTQRLIQRYIDSENVHLIEAPDWTGISAFMNFNIPIIIRLNGSDGYFCNLEGRKQKKKHFFLERKALNNADAIISVSDFTGKLTKQIFKIKSSIRTIHNSIDSNNFKPIGLKINQGQLLYFGTIIRKKGILDLAQIFNRVIEKKPSASLVLIGKDTIDVFENTSTLGLFKDLLTPKAAQNITYFDEVPYLEIQQHIAVSQVVILPSLAEAFPMTWLETLAMEKPLISSNIGWASELMIDGLTGYTINPKNHELFSDKVVKLLNDNELCYNFGKQGREHVIRNFSVEVILKQNLSFYKSLIKQ